MNTCLGNCLLGTDGTVLHDFIPCRQTVELHSYTVFCSIHKMYRILRYSFLHHDNSTTQAALSVHIFFGKNAEVCCNEFCFQNQILYLGESI
jgi:hypothetical protein